MPISSKISKNLIIEEEDLPYEEEILRNPYSVKCWSRYLEHKKTAPKTVLNLVYERALKELPGSYKLWYTYLKECRKQVRGRPITDPSYEDVNNTFERALVFMHKMPRIWLDYCQFLMDQHLITRIRRTFDRALRALPITQHYRIWPLYLKFVRSYPIPETAVRVYRRYLKLLSNNTEDYIDYLKSVGRLDEAATRLADIVNKEKFVSKEGKSNHQLWHDLCQLISKNPDKVKSLKVTDIIRGGLRRFTDSLGQLWCSLADYFIRSGHFEKARDVYEEAIQTVMTVRDFGQVFDAYAQFEEGMINTKMEATAEEEDDEDDDTDLELRLARFENLMDRRPLLLSSVLLRQNPHNVHEWHKRVKLFEGKPKEVINTYTEAVQTVEPKQATGKPHTLWVEFAKFYEQHKQITEARVIFEKATKVGYRKVDDLASVWCEYAEMEIRNENYKKALDVMKQATAMPSSRTSFYDEFARYSNSKLKLRYQGEWEPGTFLLHSETVQKRLHKSLKVWSMYADLEESLGTFESTKAVYNRILDLKIANPQIIINYAVFLEEHRYFEESFKVFERGVAMFKWPNVFDIWNTYLMKFIKRYGGTKLERIRDLFEQALEKCPAKFAKAFYLMYARLEEDHGLARHAMAIYDRATKAVLPEEQFEIFNIYIQRAAEIFGVTHTREIYEKAIEVLDDEHARDMCMRFAELERKLGEIDRARAVYMHASQIADPRTTASFWKTWHDFEVHHGNEDTFREMLRIKRSVQAKYNTQVNFMSAQMLAAAQAMSDSSTGKSIDDMEQLEKQAQSLADEARKNQPKITPKRDVLFVRGEATEEESLEEMVRSANPEEISIDDDDDDDDEATIEEVQLEQQTVPSQVFGGLAKDD